MSQIWEYIKIALMNIKGNKGRSALTMLGIIIGISSVIMIISIGNGMKTEINGELEAMAGGQINLQVNNNNEDKDIVELTEEDFAAIQEQVPHVKGVTPQYQMWASVRGRRSSLEALLSMGTHNLEYIAKEPIIAGRYFSESDYLAGRKVCVLRESAAKQIFGTANVVGMTMELTIWDVTQEVTVIGIRQDTSTSMLDMMNGSYLQPEVPISMVEDNYGAYFGGYTNCYIIGEGNQYATQIAQDSIKLMEARHNMRGENMFTTVSFSDQMGSINTVLNTITLFIVFVAAISLLVGGIGVMNIMLVSVTERTREIGIRKALGARTRSIMVQFLSESAIITLVGGLIGILIGTLGAFAVCSALGFTAEVRVTTVLGASVFSSAVGIFFGIYPAKKAARLSPIEALRHE